MLQYWRFDRQLRYDTVDSGEEDELDNEGHQIPSQDEATANHIRGQSHYLPHCQWSQDVGHLIDPPHGRIHSCIRRASTFNLV